MSLKNTDTFFKSFFTEDDIYFYNREKEWESQVDLEKAEWTDPLWFLHPSDEDNHFVKLGDYFSGRNRGGHSGSQVAA